MGIIRTMKLLTLLKEQVKKNTHKSLCINVGILCDNDEIDEGEYDILMDYIVSNKPLTIRTFLKNLGFINVSFLGSVSYWWNKDDEESRIKWLDKHIRKLWKKL